MPEDVTIKKLQNNGIIAFIVKIKVLHLKLLHKIISKSGAKMYMCMKVSQKG